MKKTVWLSLSIGLLTSCMDVKQIGDINMISNRNIESSGNYVLIKRYVGGSKKEIKKFRAKTIEQALDNTIKSTDGGEFMKNVKVYQINKKRFAVEGDIWGLKN